MNNREKIIIGLIILFLPIGIYQLFINFGYRVDFSQPKAAESNRAPSVTLKSSGKCVANCTAFFEATAADLDGDPLSYAWSGCASGSGNKA
ncbi:MAG: hypothetical protein AAB479_01475 [Patescibacteria group bacterium]|mgnify:FL=1